MRLALVVVTQLVIALMIAGVVLPGVLATFPAAQDERVGRLVIGGAVTLVFVLVRLAWPRPRLKP